jgi:hypothetical protein
MKVVVEKPSIDGETVVFRWSQSEPNPFQYENSFFLRYEGIDLARFSPFLFYEIFLGLQLNVFAAYGKPVDVVLPEPIPYSTAAYWQAFHDAEHVTISPVSQEGSYSAWAAGNPPEPPRRSIGVLFGGGKDSNLATCLLSESYGVDEVVLLQFVAPTFAAAETAERVEQRQEALMLRPAREHLGVATQRAWTDYMAQLHRCHFRVRPHLEFYTVGLLPAMLSWGISLCTTSLAWNSYPIRRLANDRYSFRYAKSRPEMLATQSTHYRRVFGADITLTNVDMHFSTFTSYRVLAERYPEAFTRIVMCLTPGPGERWCYQCKKCGDYALFGLALGMIDPRFDYNRFFAGSKHVRKVVDYVERGVERSVYGNVPWHPSFSSRNRYLLNSHAVYGISPERIAGRLGAKALGNLLFLKAAFGNTAFPTYECVPAAVTDLLDNEAARRVAAIAAQHLDVVHPLPGPFLAGNASIDYDFSVRMPTKTGLLDHIRG